MELAFLSLRQCLFRSLGPKPIDIFHSSSFRIPRPKLQTRSFAGSSQQQRKSFVNGSGQRVPKATDQANDTSSRTGPSRTVLAFSVIALLGSGHYLSHKIQEQGNSSLESHPVFKSPRFTPFFVTKKEQVSSTSFIITVRPANFPKASRDPYKESWDVGTWAVEVKQPQLMIARLYTPLPPRDGEIKGDLRFLVRKERNGEVSGYLNNLRVGDSVELRGPKAGVDIPKSVEQVVFLAGGTSIAPALQVAHTLLDRRISTVKPKIHIIWSNRRREDCEGGFGPEKPKEGTVSPIVGVIQELQKRYPSQLQVDYLVDEEGTLLDEKKISKVLNLPAVGWSPVKTAQSLRKPIAADSPSTSVSAKQKLLLVSGPDGFVKYLLGPKVLDREGAVRVPSVQHDGLLGSLRPANWVCWKI